MLVEADEDGKIVSKRVSSSGRRWEVNDSIS